MRRISKIDFILLTIIGCLLITIIGITISKSYSHSSKEKVDPRELVMRPSCSYREFQHPIPDCRLFHLSCPEYGENDVKYHRGLWVLQCGEGSSMKTEIILAEKVRYICQECL